MYYKIAEFCKEQNISISQLCTNLNIPQQAITNLKRRTQEGKKANLSVENAVKIAEFMGISVAELIRG